MEIPVFYVSDRENHMTARSVGKGLGVVRGSVGYVVAQKLYLTREAAIGCP